jgi:hypothetical protein
MEVDGAVTRNETDQLVKKLVRYALACEYSRFPIRRDGIRDKGGLSGVHIARRILTSASVWEK